MKLRQRGVSIHAARMVAKEAYTLYSNGDVRGNIQGGFNNHGG